MVSRGDLEKSSALMASTKSLSLLCSWYKERFITLKRIAYWCWNSQFGGFLVTNYTAIHFHCAKISLLILIIFVTVSQETNIDQERERERERESKMSKLTQNRVKFDTFHTTFWARFQLMSKVSFLTLLTQMWLLAHLEVSTRMFFFFDETNIKKGISLPKIVRFHMALFKWEQKNWFCHNFR